MLAIFNWWKKVGPLRCYKITHPNQMLEAFGQPIKTDLYPNLLSQHKTTFYILEKSPQGNNNFINADSPIGSDEFQMYRTIILSLVCFLLPVPTCWTSKGVVEKMIHLWTFYLTSINQRAQLNVFCIIMR